MLPDVPKLDHADARVLLECLSTTPARECDLMSDLNWTLGRLEDACVIVRRAGVRLDTRNGEIRILPCSWELAKALAQ